MASEWVIILTITGGIGIALMFVGILITALTAIGNRHYFYGACCLLCFPVAIAYCLQHKKQSAYPAKMLLPGTVLTAITGVLGWWLYHYYGFIT
ncbi:hypothetical protein [Teredinibacter purpureus]|uniref:hypothetical protein n=1 Tax=Teredinibacter purpureus TaxID=2731756 RepID=UPI001910A823|nr:hypothetical protein [Teredinibacter purpureus]